MAARPATHELVFAVRSHLSIPILIGNYAFLQGIYVPTFGSNGPLWSLANEFWYYIAFPFLAWRCGARRSVPLRLVNVVLLIAVVAFMRPPIALLGIIWLMGVAIHYLPHLPAENVLVRRLLMLAAVIACCATLAWCKQTHNPIADYVLGVVMTASDLCRPKLLAHAHAQGLQLDGARAFPLVVHAVPGARSAAGFHRGVDGACAADFQMRSRSLRACAIFAVVMIYAQVVWFFFEKRTDAIRGWIKPWVMGSAARSSKSKSAETAAQV